MSSCMRYTDVPLTSTYTSATHSLQVVHICVYAYIYASVYMHAHVYGCVCASMILFDASRRCY